MTSFNKTTISTLLVGALILGAGVYFQKYGSQRLDEARLAVQRVESAQSRANTTRDRVEQYNALLADMADQNIDQQQPFAVVSEFSPQEVSEIGPLLEMLYQRDGYFFLNRFYLSWQNTQSRIGLLPMVSLELDGRKVLLFSSGAVKPYATSERG